MNELDVGITEIWFNNIFEHLNNGQLVIGKQLLSISLVPAVSIPVSFEVAPGFEVLLPINNLQKKFLGDDKRDDEQKEHWHQQKTVPKTMLIKRNGHNKSAEVNHFSTTTTTTATTTEQTDQTKLTIMNSTINMANMVSALDLVQINNEDHNNNNHDQNDDNSRSSHGQWNDGTKENDYNESLPTNTIQCARLMISHHKQ